MTGGRRKEVELTYLKGGEDGPDRRRRRRPQRRRHIHHHIFHPQQSTYPGLTASGPRRSVQVVNVNHRHRCRAAGPGRQFFVRGMQVYFELFNVSSCRKLAPAASVPRSDGLSFASRTRNTGCDHHGRQYAANVGIDHDKKNINMFMKCRN